MNRIPLSIAFVLLVIVAVDLLADATQVRPAVTAPGTRTTIVFEVSSRSGRPPVRSAEALWGACQESVRRDPVDPGLTEVAAGRFQITVTPELPKSRQRILRGCLEDATVDLVLGRVVSMLRAPAAPG